MAPQSTLLDQPGEYKEVPGGFLESMLTDISFLGHFAHIRNDEEDAEADSQSQTVSHLEL